MVLAAMVNDGNKDFDINIPAFLTIDISGA
jgi:hypothetical protein